MSILLSICIPSYNRTALLERLSEHLFQLKSENIEFVFCDDYSTDDKTLILLKELEKKDVRVSVYFNKSNLGITKNYYKTLEHAKGKYVMLLSNEDVITEDFEEIILSKLTTYKYDAIIGALHFQNISRHNYILKNPHDDTSDLNVILNKYAHFIYRAHISGNVYKKDTLDFQLLYKIATIENNYYPIVPLTLMATSGENILLMKDSFVQIGQEKAEYINTFKESNINKKKYSKLLSIKKQLELYLIYINLIFDQSKIEKFKQALARSFIYYIYNKKKVGISHLKNVFILLKNREIGRYFRKALFGNFIYLQILFFKACLNKYI